MNQRSLFKQITLYQYRYIIGTVALVILLIGLLVIAPTIAPAGLSPQVMDSVVKSSNVTTGSLLNIQLVDIVYHSVQSATLSLFGLTWWGITLPSILFATATGVLFTLMIHRWFRLDIAIITGVMLITSAPFLTIGRSGFTLIMMVFWLSLLLLAATRVVHGSKRASVWQLVAVIAAALSLYTPLMVYPLIALAIAGSLHPHVRYIAKRSATSKLIIGSIVFFILITPLIIQAVINPAIVNTLLGLETPFSFASLGANGIEALKVLFGIQAAVIGDVPKPFFIAPVLIFATLGIAKTIIDHHSARAYLLGIWCVLLTLPVLFQPMNLYAAIIPVMIFVAIGLETTIHEWYKLFPHNPYARIAGLIPLSVLLVIMGGSGIYHYFYGHAYAESNTRYHHALNDTRAFLNENNESKSLLITGERQFSFYQLLEQSYDTLVVSRGVPDSWSDNEYILVLQGADTPPANIERIVTSSRSTESVTLRIYQPQAD